MRDVTAVAAGSLTVNATVNTAHAADEAVREIDFEIYAAMEAINQTSGINYFYSGGWYFAKGLRIVFSATWDAGAHTYPTSNQSTFIPINGNSVNAGANANLATLSLTYYLWYEANGFVIMGKPEPHADAIQHSFFTAVERNPNKEYGDGYTNFSCMAVTNYWPNGYYDGTNQTSINRMRGILRPFAYQYPDGTGVVKFSVNGNGISFVPMPSYLAFKSNGNGKVYYVKPILNNSNNQLSPIFQAELWFPWSETVGLIDGDVIAVEGTTTKYLCKSLDSPDSTNRLIYAIKYVA